MSEALIVFMLKAGRDPKECASYRPISLLHADAKILSLCISKEIDDLFHVDQTGFMLGKWH